MIRQSFIFLAGVGLVKEKQLWQQGINSWDKFLNAENIKGISKKSKLYYDRQLIKARRNLYNFNSAYFCNILLKTEHWRLYDFFKEDAVFLDIETSGVEEEAYITVIGLFDGINTKTMIRGINLDYNILKNELNKYKIIVSFNGSVFDVPFINKRIKNLFPNIPHFDLRFGCKRVGLLGGLKDIEKELSIKRNNIIDRMYGGDVFRLWRMYRASGDDYYLNLLVEYNEEDIINLKRIANLVYKKLIEKVFNNK